MYAWGTGGRLEKEGNREVQEVIYKWRLKGQSRSYPGGSGVGKGDPKRKTIMCRGPRTNENVYLI